MNEFCKLMETLSQIDEGAFSEIDIAIQELKAKHPDAKPVDVVAHVRRTVGNDAAKYVSDQFEREGDKADWLGEEEGEIEFLQYPEGYEPPPLPERHPLDSLDWMMKGIPDDVIQMM